MELKIEEGQEVVIVRTCVNMQKKITIVVLKGIVVLNLIIKLNNYIQRKNTKQNFVHNTLIKFQHANMALIVLLHTHKKIFNWN